MAAIEANTRIAAELLRSDDRLGTRERGKLADVIVVLGTRCRTSARCRSWRWS